MSWALLHHLQYNHFPPIDASFVPVAEQAIDLANQGEWADEITMPNGITRTVAEIVDGMHLDFFVEADYD